MANYKLSVSTSTADWLIAIVSAIIAALTFIVNNISPVSPTLSTAIIVGAIIAFLTAILNAQKIVSVPAPTVV